jgi:DNA polymerase-3 subunit delta'
VPDVFDGVLGQERAVQALRHHVRHPVHAYLFTGPPGAGMREALLAFTAALQCPDGGCGLCESCRSALNGVDADVVVIERSAVNWRTDEMQEAERISRRAPLGRGHQIVVVENIELAEAARAALLKILEEPPSRTVFILTAESLPEWLATIQSRCVEVPFAPLSEEVITDYLVRRGDEPVAARAAAAASGGDLRRAQVLATDPELASRIALWQSVPDRLDGISAHSSELVGEITNRIDRALEPLQSFQDAELARLTENAKAVGQRGLPRRKEFEAQFKREQRRFRTDDLRFGLSSLAHVYRERLLEGLEGAEEGDRRGRLAVAGALRAVELVESASRALSTNADEPLLLTNLFLALANC